MTHQITILSGKGGAGKTSITAALIKMLDAVVAVDADVNASNLPLLLPHFPRSVQPYYSMDIARIDQQACSRCGLCLESCRFDAIIRNPDGSLQIASDCEGCALCARICPEQAIDMAERKGGDWYVSATSNGYLIHADLIPGQDNSGKLITKVRNEASRVAREKGFSYLVIDGPPGTSCQAISSVSGTDLVLAIVEESLAGLSDYQRLAELIGHFSLPHLVLLNKTGFNPALQQRIMKATEEFGGRVVGQIPFDVQIPEALQELQTLSDMDAYRPTMARVLTEIKASLAN